MENKDLVSVDVTAWEVERNRVAVKVRWRFTTEDVRTKLGKLYSVLEKPGERLG
jgi:hypothetical protein